MRRRVRFGWASLTETDLVITELVAEGRTNREIAGQLFLSRHTIDSHIRHNYCKLGIASRIQLTRLVLSTTDPGLRARVGPAEATGASSLPMWKP